MIARRIRAAWRALWPSPVQPVQPDRYGTKPKLGVYDYAKAKRGYERSLRQTPSGRIYAHRGPAEIVPLRKAGER